MAGNSPTVILLLNGKGHLCPWLVTRISKHQIAPTCDDGFSLLFPNCHHQGNGIIEINLGGGFEICISQGFFCGA